MDSPQGVTPSKGHSRSKSATKASRLRSATRGPLDVEENPLASTTSLPQRVSDPPSRNASPAMSIARAQSPAKDATFVSETPATAKSFGFLLKPELYHQVSPLNVPPPFRDVAKQPPADATISSLLSKGYFRAAAIAAAQELTGTSPMAEPVKPTDHVRIFELLYVRLSCLCLIDAVPLAAQEAKALEDLNSTFYVDADTDAHLAPWHLRTLAVRLQTIGFGDPRRAVMSYYELARGARMEIARARQAHDHSAAETWKRRLADLGIRVAGALIEMDDLVGAAAHLASLTDSQGGGSRLAICRALLLLHLGDVDGARRCASHEAGDGVGGLVVDALASMADAEYEAALVKWQALRDELRSNDVQDEMVGVNLAVCLLYTGRMSEGRELLEELVTSGLNSHTLLFNLTTLYELCTDRAKNLKMLLAERVASLAPGSGGSGWEKTNVDFKL